MKAVVMAGGEGTRLRPLTSNQPKPMVPIVGRPCMEHIVHLLRRHGFDDVIVTVAFMPQAIRTYFGEGEAHGVSLQYSVEEAPAGTAGSVRLADDALDDTFLVISGDAVCDVDLSALVRFHKEKGASVTVGLKSVDHPLEFGIVVIDEEGRIERFLEKPSWGEVFSDTINTGIYVLEPEVLRHVPVDRPYDFSKELFPLLLEMGRPLYGYVLDGYWQDIGNIDQFRQANFDALDQQVDLDIPGLRLRGHIWLGEGVEIDDLGDIEGPAFLGNYCRIAPTARVGPHSVLSSGVVLREGARVSRSVVDQQTYFGRSVLVEGAFVGRSCDVRARARIHERAAIGDECTLGPESVVMPGVRIYPFKEVESGAVVDRNVIWESRAAPALTGPAGLSGLVNVDLTPEAAVRVGMAIGTALRRGARVVASRSQQPSCRLIKRAVLVGIASTGVHVDDLRVLPAAVNRHLLKSLGLDAGVHVRPSSSDPEVVQIQVFEPPGVAASPALEKEIAKHFSRQEFRRASSGDLGELSFPARAAESYVSDLLRTLDVEPVRRRRFRIVIDYCYSSASLILPLVLGALDVETIGSHAHVTGGPPVSADASLEESIAQTSRLVEAVGADLGVVIDQAAERLYLVDEQAHEIPTDEELLLFVSLLAKDSRRGSLALPVTATSLVERIVDGSGLEVRRTPASLAALTRAATEEGVVFAGAPGGGFVFPSFLPAYDAMASLVNLLQLLAPIERPLSEIVAELPRSTLVHREVRCPWALKGTVMRVLTEQTKGRQTSTLDGIKIFENGAWSQVVPDPEQPLVHIYAEAESPEEAARLERALEDVVQTIISREEAGETATPGR
jgi:mannose-1-phosphate guanylyltransferase / phosphomannomutase